MKKNEIQTLDIRPQTLDFRHKTELKKWPEITQRWSPTGEARGLLRRRIKELGYVNTNKYGELCSKSQEA